MFLSLSLVLSLILLGSCESPDSSYLHDPRNVHNVEHIKEHMGDYYKEDELEKLKLDDDQAMEFHYFKLHDYDNNNKLDGLELGAAMTHFHEDGVEGQGQAHSISLSDDELANLIESILAEDDLNNDGYVDYYEFIHAQKTDKQQQNDQL